jgi:hypothetical protein
MTEETRPGWDGWLSPRIWVPGLVVLLGAIAVLAILALRDDGTASANPGNPPIGRVGVHEHADFALYIRGQRFDFNQPQFISTAERELSPAAHIHAPRTNVVHVHLDRTTWDEFFRSLGFELTDDSLKLPDGTLLKDNERETLKFYVNGVHVDALMFSNIRDLDRVLISYGPETREEVERTQLPLVTDEACIVSGRCLDRIDPNEPPEECSGQGACH